MRKLCKILCVIIIGITAAVLPGGNVLADEEVEINRTNFPDDTFRYVVSEWADRDKNGKLNEWEILVSSSLNVFFVLSGKDKPAIASLKGLEFFPNLSYIGIDDFCRMSEVNFSDFPNLEEIHCANAGISSLRVTNCPKCRVVACGDNPLTALSVDSRDIVEQLDITGAKIRSIDLSGWRRLQLFSCSGASLASLDVTNNTYLTGLDISHTSFETVDLSHNSRLELLTAYETNLKCLDLRNNPKLSEENVFTDVETVLYFEAGEGTVIINSENFPDDDFRNYVSDQVDTDYNGVLSEEEADAIQVMDLSNLRITSLQGIEYFQDIRKLSVRGSGLLLDSIDFGMLPRLEVLTTEYCDARTLDFRNCTSLKKITLSYIRFDIASLNEETISVKAGDSLQKIELLYCYEYSIVDLNNCPGLKEAEVSFDGGMPHGKLDVSGCLQLEKLKCAPVKELDVSHNIHLKYLGCTVDKPLELSHNTELEELYLSDGGYKQLDVSRNTKLEKLYIGYGPISELDLSHNVLLKELSLECCWIPSLDLTHNPELEKLYIEDGPYKQLDLSRNKQLKKLGVRYGPISGLDLSYHTQLEELSVEDCKEITSLDLSHNRKLKKLFCYGTGITSLDLDANTELEEVQLDFHNEDGTITYNELTVKVSADGTFDLTGLKGFKPDKSSKWSGASRDGNTLVFTKELAAYNYRCSRKVKGKFTLRAKFAPVKKGKVYTAGDYLVKVTKLPAGSGKTGTVTVTGYKKGKPKKLQIPAAVKIGKSKFKVTAIGKGAFKASAVLKEVVIGSNVKTIGEGAFSSCKKLVTAAWKGTAVTTLGDRAFYNCKALRQFTIPKNVKGIGKSAFQGCERLKLLTIKTAKLKEAGVGRKAFSGLKTNVKVVVPKKSLKAYKKWLYKKGLPKTAEITDVSQEKNADERLARLQE